MCLIAMVAGGSGVGQSLKGKESYLMEQLNLSQIAYLVATIVVAIEHRNDYGAVDRKAFDIEAKLHGLKIETREE